MKVTTKNFKNRLKKKSVMQVAVVTKMKSKMEVATEVKGANAMKSVMEVPAE